VKKGVTSKEAIERWDRQAERLAANIGDQGDRNREVLLNPVIFDLLGEVAGRRILDAGCGEGYLSRLLASRGATVVAVDYSEYMIRIARARTPPGLSVEYHYANCENLGFLPGGSFDLIVSNMVMQDLADLCSALSEMHRLLRPRGWFILSISHPCFVTPSAGWVRDNDGKKLHWAVDRYFEEGPHEQNWPPYELIWFHRTLTTYFRALKKTGFIIEDFVEPTPAQDKLEKFPDFRDDVRMCHFLVFKARISRHRVEARHRSGQTLVPLTGGRLARPAPTSSSPPRP
jgi:ubiquinone/menaquinone biosynthesis C-methylase UbiE